VCELTTIEHGYAVTPNGIYQLACNTLVFAMSDLCWRRFGRH
jgi:hypothetical protein